ncbi:MAG: putative sulfate exporter family transporter [Bacteroidales bacterium]|nr:putative sulfate exporter family transporter [Candidatus Physcousia equi]
MTKKIYFALIAAFTFLLSSDYIPALQVLNVVTPPIALALGLLFALTLGQPCPKTNKKMSKMLLQYSVVGMGFGMNVEASLESGGKGMAFTVASVAATMLIGWVIGRKVCRVDKETTYLISSGTAICGGSAIAAVGPVIKAKDSSMSVALATVFVLNAIALFLFPLLGEWMNMTQEQFGSWAAIAIHDTSSVVGAGQAYGKEALEVAVTIKLTRALWIVPLALVTSFIWKNGQEGGKRKLPVPMFIIWFILAIVFNTYVLSNTAICSTWGSALGSLINGIARKGLILSMFFIGASLSRDTLRQVGLRPMLQGVLLWIIISCASLAYIML